MDIKNVRIYGFTDSIIRAKYPMATDVTECSDIITPTISALATSPRGSGEDQFLTGIIVQFDLTCSLKMWPGLQRYHFVDFVSSQSTMHRITKFDVAEQCNDYVTGEALHNLKWLVDRYNDCPTAENYLYVLYNIPSGFNLTAGLTTNYRQLKTIYAQRKNHRLPEWRDFCKALRTFPHPEFITGGE